MNATTLQLEPGIHRGIAAADYHALPYCSNSRLSTLIDRCPAMVQHEMSNPRESTPSLDLGSAVHSLVLEPETFADLYAVAPKCDRRTNAGKAMWAEFCADTEGLTILSADDHTAAAAMAKAVWHNAHARDALAAAPDREVSLVWEDEKNGLLCKGRVDALGADARLIVDLKTTAHAGRAFERSMDEYGYARQAAFYVHGAAALGITIDDFLIVAVEKTAPFLVGLHRVSDAAIEAAWKELRPAIEAYWTCVTTNIWPGYEPRDSDLPAYAHKRIAALAAE